MPVQIGDIVVDQLEPPGTIVWRRGTWVSNAMQFVGQASWLAAVWIHTVMRDWPAGKVAAPGLMLFCALMLLLAGSFQTEVLRPLPVLEAHVRRRRTLTRLRWALGLSLVAAMILLTILWRPTEGPGVILGVALVAVCLGVIGTSMLIERAEDRLLTEVERAAAAPAA